ncbi:MAG: nicotinamide-nucleotide adenylyltransferase [Thermoplasmatota archaeon]
MRVLLLGRFQPFHRGHASVAEYAIDRYGELVVAIGSARQSYTTVNPFTGGERYQMAHGALASFSDRVAVVPVPDINRYAVYPYHVTDLCPSFDVVLSNKPLIREIFGAAGYRIEDTPEYERERYRGTVIRGMMAQGDEAWRDLVPSSVEAVIDDVDGAERVRRLYEGER